MTIEENLVQRYGPLVPLSGLASVLDRSPEAVPMFLRSNCDLARRINTSKVKVGRRLYFRAGELAHCLSSKASQ